MIAAFDVHYTEDAKASAAAVIFNDYGDAAPIASVTHLIHDVADYIPGKFYKRELPCLLNLRRGIHVPLTEMIIDGYVMHRDGAGLGQYLYVAFDGQIPIVGVAKNPYVGSSAVAVLRGRSRRPLWVTSAGIAPTEAASRIERMHGPYRIPTLLRYADQLARKSCSGVGDDAVGPKAKCLG
ncbi:MAG: endonuclease V [Desulfobacteraceae bacterium]